MTLNDKYQIPNGLKDYAISKCIADTFSLSGPNLIGIHEVCVAIPASTIEKFRGFELIGVSEPKDSLSFVSQAYWDWFVGKETSTRSCEVSVKSNNQKNSEKISEDSGSREQGKSTASSRSSTQRQSAYERAAVNRVVNEVYRRSYPSSRSSSSSSRGNMNYQYRSR